MENEIIADLQQSIDDTARSLRADLAKLRTGRATVSILDGVRVSYYGVPTPLNQCASLTVADARTLMVKPFEKKMLADIEKALNQSDVGIAPQSDGEVIRLPVPPLNEERRKDLVKQARSRGEDAKISLRNHRRDANDMLKQLEKDKEISQDDLKRALEKVQTLVDKGGQVIDEILTTKEQEIMAV